MNDDLMNNIDITLNFLFMGYYFCFWLYFMFQATPFVDTIQNHRTYQNEQKYQNKYHTHLYEILWKVVLVYIVARHGRHIWIVHNKALRFLQRCQPVTSERGEGECNLDGGLSCSHTREAEEPRLAARNLGQQAIQAPRLMLPRRLERKYLCFNSQA